MVLTGSFDVSIRNSTELVELHGWTLRVHRSDGRFPRVLLLIHGRTGDENSMWVFVRSFPPDYCILAPRATYATKPTGYSWLRPAPVPMESPSLLDLEPSAHALVSLLDDYAAQNGLDVGQFDALGFSEGAATASALAVMYPHRIRRLGILSGFVPRGAEEILKSRPLMGKPVFVAHGTADELVEIDRARQSVRLLEQAGARITFCEAEIGHKVSASCLRALESFFA